MVLTETIRQRGSQISTTEYLFEIKARFPLRKDEDAARRRRFCAVEELRGQIGSAIFLLIIQISFKFNNFECQSKLIFLTSVEIIFF